MQDSNIPSKFPIPWANAAGGSFIVTIPTASQIGITPGAASLTDGFVPVNFVNDSAGGVNPRGVDFNGILKQITQWCQWEQAGAPVAYDATFSAAIGGYPKGAVLSAATLGAFWLSTVDNNSTNPDAGGAGWVSWLSGRYLNTQRFLTAGTFTYTPTAGTNSIEVEVQAGGGAGSGSPATGASQISCGGGGGSGAWAMKRILSGFSGATVTVGVGGVPALGAAGGNGGTSSLGALASALGGLGGSPAGPASSSSTFSSAGGAAGSSGVSGDLNVTGGAGASTIVLAGSIVIFPAAPSKFSGGYGAGGIGTGSPGSSSAAVMGQAGQVGAVIIREYS